jgi:hypothetical protein
MFIGRIYLFAHCPVRIISEIMALEITVVLINDIFIFLLED